MRGERGESLIEVVVAVAIVALASAALLGGTLVVTRRFGPDLAQKALENAAHREMRLVVDVMKYQGNTIAPTTVATTIPMPGASPAAAHLSVSTATLDGDATTVSIKATLDSNSTGAVTLTTTVGPPVPLPASTVLVDGSAPQ